LNQRYTTEKEYSLGSLKTRVLRKIKEDRFYLSPNMEVQRQDGTLTLSDYKKLLFFIANLTDFADQALQRKYAKDRHENLTN